jgi:hypothetical protein
MDRFSTLLGTIVFFLFPLPFLLDFAVAHGSDWSGWLAYVAVAVLASAAVAVGVIASRRGK